MAKRTPNYCLVLILLVISTGITYWARSKPPVLPVSADLASVPRHIGVWRADGPDVEPTKDALEGWLVVKKDFLIRDYVDDYGNQINLLMVYKGQDRRGWHMSEMCFSGSGYNVTQTRILVPYAGHKSPAVKLVAVDTNTRSKVISVYWMAQGRHAESSFAKQQFSMALARMHPSKEGWSFIRVTSGVYGSEEETMTYIRNFIRSASDPMIRAMK
ncbi:MAG: exosortase C-terminal domain/associated protein EpsI [Armatimonadota bacterium]